MEWHGNRVEIFREAAILWIGDELVCCLVGVLVHWHLIRKRPKAEYVLVAYGTHHATHDRSQPVNL